MPTGATLHISKHLEYSEKIIRPDIPKNVQIYYAPSYLSLTASYFKNRANANSSRCNENTVKHPYSLLQSNKRFNTAVYQGLNNEQ